MNVLGVFPLWGHDTCAALVKDGKLVAAVEEERFTRRKHSFEAPVNSIKYCLREGKVSMDEVDAIAVPWSPKLIMEWHLRRGARILPDWVFSAAMLPARRLWQYKRKFRKGLGYTGALYYDLFMKGIFESWNNLPEIKYYEHHRAHAATAFYASGFDRAGVITVDGSGEKNATVAWKGHGNKIAKVKEKLRSESLGDFYSHVSTYLNIGWAAEGKTMGLAPYGKPNPEIKEKLKKFINPDKGEWYEGNIEPLNKGDRGLTQEDLGFPKRTNQPIIQPPYADLAYAAQELLEESLLKVARDTVETTGARNLCLAGGVALNCTTNSRILNEGICDDIFIFPAANDGGTAIGSALECAAEMGEKINFRLEHAYWGPGWSDAEVEQVLKENKIKHEVAKDPSGSAAELIAKGKVIGWFQGRMEIGPRALGNRSILADPTRADVWERVNEVKLREKWRPLAPSMLFEAKDEYLENARESPFMILAFQVPKEKHREIPAVVHVDGSTRPQTVKKTVNERYWKLIKGLEDANGTPVVLNTSFNVGPEPVVCTPQDAIKTFFTSQLDALVIGNCVLQK